MAQRSTAATLIAMCFLWGCSFGDSTTTIGVIVPAAAEDASYAKEIEQGARLAVEEIARRGGPAMTLQVRKVSDPSGAVSVARDLISRHDPIAIIGVPEPAPFLQGGDGRSRERVPILSIGSSGGRFADTRDVLRLTPSAVDQASVMAKWLTQTRGMRRIAFVSSADAYGEAGVRALKDAIAAASGAQLVSEHQIPSGSVDPSPQAQAIKAANPEAVVMWLGAQQAAHFAIAARQIGLDAQLIGTDRLMRGEFRSLAGDASEDVAVVFPDLEPAQWFSERLRDWFLDLHRRFSIVTIPDQRTLVADLPFDAAVAYDAVSMIASTDAREDLVEALRGSTYQGVLFTYSLNDSGEAFDGDGLTVGRFFNLAYLNDVTPESDVEEQIAFYKVQASAYYVPDAYLDTPKGRELADRVLEEVLADPEAVDFFRPYAPPRPPPGRI